MPDKAKPRPRDTPDRKINRAPLSSRPWNRFRTALLKDRRKYCAEHDVSLCERCEAEGKPYEAISPELHHIIPRAQRPDLAKDKNNLMWLCKQHHSVETRKEQLGIVGCGRRTVVCGAPGSGKTTFVHRNAKEGDLIWDADDVAAQNDMGVYPRSDLDVARLRTMRDRFVERIKSDPANVWIIVRWPKTAQAIAREIGATIVNMGERKWTSNQ